VKYKIIKKIKNDGRDFEIGYATSKEQAEGLVAYYNENNEDVNSYYIKMAMPQKEWEWKSKRK
jgi:hypothetical protein